MLQGVKQQSCLQIIAQQNAYLFNHSLLALIFIQVLQEEFEDTKGAIKIHLTKKNRQHNGQKEMVQKDKQRSTKHTYKTKD